MRGGARHRALSQGPLRRGAGHPSAYIAESYDAVASTDKVLPVNTGAQLQETSNSLLALEGLSGSILTIFDQTSGASYSFEGPGLANLLGRPVGDVAFFEHYPEFEKPEGWIWRRATKTIEPLVQPVGQYVVDIRSDGSTIVWIQVPPKESFADFWPQGDLWTSPFAETKVNLTPTKRRPAPIVGDVPAAIGEGYYALYSLSDFEIHVYRLSDMHHWSFAPPPETLDFSNLAYIDDTWVWYQTITGVYRQRLDALGSGDPAP